MEEEEEGLGFINQRSKHRAKADVEKLFLAEDMANVKILRL